MEQAGRGIGGKTSVGFGGRTSRNLGLVRLEALCLCPICYLCPIYVLLMSYVCPVYVPFMSCFSCLCIVYVLLMSCLCPVYVLFAIFMSYLCHVFANVGVFFVHLAGNEEFYFMLSQSGMLVT